MQFHLSCSLLRKCNSEAEKYLLKIKKTTVQDTCVINEKEIVLKK